MSVHAYVCVKKSQKRGRRREKGEQTVATGRESREWGRRERTRGRRCAKLLADLAASDPFSVPHNARVIQESACAAAFRVERSRTAYLTPNTNSAHSSPLTRQHTDPAAVAASAHIAAPDSAQPAQTAAAQEPGRRTMKAPYSPEEVTAQEARSRQLEGQLQLDSSGAPSGMMRVSYPAPAPPQRHAPTVRASCA